MDIEVKLIADQLGKSLENLGSTLERELQQFVGQYADAAYSAMAARIQSSSLSDSTKKSYLDGLKFKKIGQASWIIYLEGQRANEIEDGVAPHDMRTTLLRSSAVVESGPRAGQPWVRTSKKGHKYAAVPFEAKMKQTGLTGSLKDDIKNTMVTNAQGQLQSMAKVFKDFNGNPIQGKVVEIHQFKDNPNMRGMMKYQNINAKGKVSSYYVHFATISEAVSGGWMHPGTNGIHIFEDTERQLRIEIENLINRLVK